MRRATSITAPPNRSTRADLMTAAEEALGKVLTLDPTNTGALMLRGLIAVDAGDSQAAVQYLEQVSDLDSRPDGLRALLRAKLHTGKLKAWKQSRRNC